MQARRDCGGMNVNTSFPEQSRRGKGPTSLIAKKNVLDMRDGCPMVAVESLPSDCQ